MKKHCYVLLGLSLLFFGACHKEPKPQSAYCDNFRFLMAADTVLPTMNLDFNMRMDSLSHYVSEQVNGDSCGGAFIGLQLHTGDTLALWIPFMDCSEITVGCLMLRPLFDVKLNKASQVLLNGKMLPLQNMAQNAQETLSFELSYRENWTFLGYHPETPSDSVYKLLEEVIALHFIHYEFQSQTIYKKPLCQLERQQVQALKETQAMLISLDNRHNFPPPPPPPPDSSFLDIP